jgi:MFS superfamily sulfate permease-like transporter
MEWAGAFGDLGTLLPFVIAYVSIVKMDPFGILFSIGLVLIACGLYYRTPFPIQPMKAIGAVAATQAAQTAVVTPSTIHCASLATGLIWLILGMTGATRVIARWVPRCVILGIVVGLGFSFMLQGIRMMAQNWWMAAPGLLGTVLLLRNRRVPVMFLLLLFGGIWGLVSQPGLIDALVSIRPQLRMPNFNFSDVSAHELLLGSLVLSLPQLPLTLGNAIIAIHEENNRLFPDRPVTEDGVARSTGVVNLTAFLFGGIPICHGAGGMAGHVAFGARTGGAPIILGVILLISALFFSGSIATLFEVIPSPVLGIILFLTGAQLALGSGDLSQDKTERFITLATAAFSVWNVALAFIAGLAFSLLRRCGLRL